MSKTIYIDSEFKCHISDNGTLTAVETDFFDGKCAAYIEGYRFVPSGSTWTRPDGVVFAGEMITPWKDWRELDAAQREYEREQIPIIREEITAYKSEIAELKTQNETLLQCILEMSEIVYA